MNNWSVKKINQVLDRYPIGFIENIRFFENGAVNTNILVETNNKKYVFREYNTRPMEWVLFEHDLLKFLRQHNYPVSLPIEDNNNICFNLNGGKVFGLFEFIDGEVCENPNAHHQAIYRDKIVEHIAKLNKIAEDYIPNNEYKREGCDKQSCLDAANNEIKQKPHNDLFEKRLFLIEKELNSVILPDDMQMSICHGDCNHGNFLFIDDKISGVLDFDMACKTYAIYDLANLIYWWTWPPETKLNFDQAKAIVDTYQKYRPLDSLEKKHLYDALILVVLMSLAWGIAEDDFDEEYKRIVELKEIDRQKFATLVGV